MKRLLLVIVAAAVAAIALPLGAQAASGPSAEGTGQSSTYGSVHVNAHPVPFSTQHPFGAEGHFFIKKQGVHITLADIHVGDEVNTMGKKIDDLTLQARQIEVRGVSGH